MSWNENFNEAIAKFKAGQPVNHLLESINTTTRDFELQGRFDEAGIRFCLIEEFDFLIPMEDGIYPDYFFDCFDDIYEEINTDNDSEILKGIYEGIEFYLGGMPPHLEMTSYDGLVLSRICHILGQAGPDFFDFNIFKTVEECKRAYIKKGWLISYSRGGVSHSDAELIKLFKRYIKSKNC